MQQISTNFRPISKKFCIYEILIGPSPILDAKKFRFRNFVSLDFFLNLKSKISKFQNFCYQNYRGAHEDLIYAKIFEIGRKFIEIGWIKVLEHFWVPYKL